jgi:hypothetical protein
MAGARWALDEGGHCLPWFTSIFVLPLTLSQLHFLFPTSYILHPLEPIHIEKFPIPIPIPQVHKPSRATLSAPSTDITLVLAQETYRTTNRQDAGRQTEDQESSQHARQGE